MGSPLLKKSSRNETRVQIQGTGKVLGAYSPKTLKVEICDLSPSGISFLSKKSDFQKGEPVQISVQESHRVARLKGFIISIAVTPETIPLARFSVKFEKKFTELEFKDLLTYFVFK